MGFSKVKLVGTGGSSIRVENERTQVAVKARGLIAENYPILATTGVSAATSQVAYGSALGLRAGDVVTNVVVGISVAAVGTAPTLARMGLADSTGVVVAVTADVGAAANFTQGVAAFALSAAYTVPSDGAYFACFLVNGTWGTTQPTFARVQPANWCKAYGSGVTPAFQWASQTDLPAVGASLTMTAVAANALWIAVS